MAQPILTDGGPPAWWAVDKRAELGWPSSRGKGWPAAVCKSGPRLCSFTVQMTKVGSRVTTTQVLLQQVVDTYYHDSQKNTTSTDTFLTLNANIDKHFYMELNSV